VIVTTLVITTVLSLAKTRRDNRRASRLAVPERPAGPDA
jgi:hypothetical protein